MNKTQKGAWYNLAMTILLLVFSIIWIAKVFFLPGRLTQTPSLVFFLLYWLMIGVSILFFRRKQSKTEVDFDERDTLIKRRAVQISYISLWVLLIVASVVPFVITDQRGLIPVSALPPIVFLIFLIVMLIYSMAILIQYGRGGKDGEK